MNTMPMNAMRKTDSLTDVIHSSMDGIHLVRPDVVRPDAAPVSKVMTFRTGLAAERITAAVLLVMCIAAAVLV